MAVTVNMALPAGSNIPTQINLKDGTTLTPNAAGVIAAPAQHVADLLSLGWQIQITGNPPTHVP